MPVTPIKRPGAPAPAKAPAPAAAPKAVGGFKRPTPVAKVDTTPKRPASIYSGMKSKPPREPMAPYGAHRVRLESASQHRHPDKKTLSNHYVYSVVETTADTTAVGEVFKVLTFDTSPGRRELGHMTMALLGYDPDDAQANEVYNEYNQDGRLYDATLGLYDSGQHWIDANGGNQPMIGRIVEVVVTQGNAVIEKGEPTGDHYRNFSWTPIEESEQEVPQPTAPEEYWVD